MKKPRAPQASRPLSLFAVALAGAGTLLLGALSGRALIHSSQLQTELDRGYALQSAATHIAEAMASGGEAALTAALSEILSERWGFTALAITARDGRTLASRSYQGSNAAPMGLLFFNRLQHSESGQLTLKTPPEAALEYSLGPSQARLVHDEALDRLRSFGIAGSLLTLLFGSGLVLLLRQSLLLARHEEDLQERLLLTPKAPPRKPVKAPPIAAVADDLGATLDAFGVAMILVGPDLHVLQLNAAAARLTGWPEADAQGQLIYTVFHPREEGGAPVTSPAERCVRENRDIPYEELRLRPRSDNQPDQLIEAAASGRLLGNGERGALMLFADVQARVKGREELRSRSRLTELVVDQLNEGVLTTDPAGVVKTANLRVQRLFGYSQEELMRMTISRLLPVPFMNTPGVRLADFANPGNNRMPKVAGWRKDATTFPAEIAVKAIQVGTEQRMVVTVTDISARQRSVSLVQRLGRLLDQASEEIYIFDTQSLYFIEVNAGARKNLGMNAEDLSRMSLVTIATGLEPGQLEGYLQKLRGGEAEHYTYLARHRRTDGTSYPVEVRLSYSREEEPPVFMAIAQDITEREAAEKRMRQLAHYDMLTGLPNRALLFDRLKQAMVSSQRAKRTLAVFFLDLNGFKPINDNYGHEAGDEVLKMVAERISAGLRAGDTVARLGGDEFVVLALGLNDVSDVTALAWKILELFEAPFEVRGKALRMSTSLGITLYPQDHSEPEGLLRHADAAMYQSKQAGPGRFHFYDVLAEPQASKGGKTRRNLSREIPAALASGQFQCQFWPVFGVDDQLLSAAVADFYWNHPSHGRIDAAETLLTAQRAGLNAELELWLIKEVIRQYQHAERLGIPLIPTCVTLTGRQWRDPEFSEVLSSLLHDSSAPALGLLLVINAADWADAAGAVQMLWPRLLEQGVRIALRDPEPEQTLESVGAILLPPSYAEHVLEEARVVERIRAYAATGRPLIAEGVSTPQQRERLQMLGCTYFAGGISGGALSPSEFAAWFGVRKVKPL